jgi:hypothetical protein
MLLKFLILYPGLSHKEMAVNVPNHPQESTDRPAVPHVSLSVTQGNKKR